MTVDLGLNHSIRRVRGFETARVEGSIPATLRGTLYRTGPGLLERFGRRVAHPFDADGAITAIRFGNDEVTTATRPVESAYYREEETAGRFLYGTSASRSRQIANLLRSRTKGTGNTNLLSWQDRLFALVENAKPEELEQVSLGTLGTQDFGVVRAAFSAHPHRVHSRKTTYNFGMHGDGLDLYALPDVGSAKHLGRVKLPWQGMVHDFIVTERHFVFVIGPAKLIRWRAALAIGDLSGYFRWDPSAGAVILVVPIDCPEKVVRFEVETFWVWHFVNAFEDGDVTQIDLCRHEGFGAFAAPSNATKEHSNPELWRYSVDCKRHLVRSQALWREPTEFPSVDPRVAGARQRFSFLQTFPDDVRTPGVARFDHETGDVLAWGAPHSHLGVEPVFVARGSREGEGFVLQLFQDVDRDESYLAVLDAEHLSDGPVAKVWLGEAIPMTFHGIFVDAA